VCVIAVLHYKCYTLESGWTWIREAKEKVCQQVSSASDWCLALFILDPGSVRLVADAAHEVSDRRQQLSRGWLRRRVAFSMLLPVVPAPLAPVTLLLGRSTWGNPQRRSPLPTFWRLRSVEPGLSIARSAATTSHWASGSGVRPGR